MKTDAADTRKDAEDLLNLAQMAADAASRKITTIKCLMYKNPYRIPCISCLLTLAQH